MDKKRKKQLVNELRIKRLEAMLVSDDPEAIHHAKVELGIIPEPMTEELILSTAPVDLVKLVVTRAEDKINAIYNSDPRKYKDRELLWSAFPNFIRFLHDIYYFEMMVFIGDCVKYVDSEDDKDKARLIEGYNFFGFPGIALPMIDGDWEGIEKWHDRHRTAISESLIKFIRDNASNFTY
jgi:hypothetical protein